jgi:hypothetical protein
VERSPVDTIKKNQEFWKKLLTIPAQAVIIDNVRRAKPSKPNGERN